MGLSSFIVNSYFSENRKPLCYFPALVKETELLMTSPPALFGSHNITQLSMRDQTSAGHKSVKDKQRGERRVRKLECFVENFNSKQ